MATKHSIMNEALRILHEAPLQNVDEQSEKGRLLRSAWDDAVVYCFEQGAWNFLEVRAELAQSDVTPPFGYGKVYALPADCVRILLVSETGFEGDDSLNWKEEAGGIATDADRLFLRYVSDTRRKTPGAWSQTFADWVAAVLAQRCTKLNPSAEERAERVEARRRREVRNLDAVQAPPKQNRMGSWAAAARGRRTGTGMMQTSNSGGGETG